MALALGSIPSKFKSANQLNEADRAYIEAFRNANEDGNIVINIIGQKNGADGPIATYQTLANESDAKYKASMQEKKRQIIRENQLIKRFRTKSRWKYCFIWILASIIVAIILFIIYFLH